MQYPSFYGPVRGRPCAIRSWKVAAAAPQPPAPPLCPARWEGKGSLLWWKRKTAHALFVDLFAFYFTNLSLEALLLILCLWIDGSQEASHQGSKSWLRTEMVFSTWQKVMIDIRAKGLLLRRQRCTRVCEVWKQPIRGSVRSSWAKQNKKKKWGLTFLVFLKWKKKNQVGEKGGKKVIEVGTLVGLC